MQASDSPQRDKPRLWLVIHFGKSSVLGPAMRGHLYCPRLFLSQQRRAAGVTKPAWPIKPNLSATWHSRAGFLTPLLNPSVVERLVTRTRDLGTDTHVYMPLQSTGAAQDDDAGEYLTLHSNDTLFLSERHHHLCTCPRPLLRVHNPRPTCAVPAGGCTCVIGYCVGTGGTPVGNAGKTPGASDTAGGTMLGTP